ncbi:MAG: phytanoyl-CoA dioxygenase family protein [Acidobacteriota bacterium]|nr:phytanoyl-CoA dioxygenase family protein [Acidobacteriota bacterium]
MNRPELRVVFEPEIPDYDPALYRYQELAEGITGFESVNEEELARFRQRGFLVVHGAFSMARVEAARRELYRLGTSPRPDCESVYFEGAVRQQLPALKGKPVDAPKGRRFVDLALGHTDNHLPPLEPATRMRFVRKFMGFTREENPALKALAEDPSLIRVLGRILGGKPALYQDMALIKPPGGREKPWHQDRAYFNLTQTTRILGVWIALDEATPENGCMQVVEGGHRQGPRVHFMRRDWQICDSEVARRPRVAIPMEAGGCLLFDALLRHVTPANRTEL